MSAHVRIGELASVLHARSNPWKAMALLRAYFDESGIHKDSPLTGVAGFVADCRDWVALEDAWCANLKRASDTIGREITWFHAVDCENGMGEWFGISLEIREAFYLSFASILNDNLGLKGFSVAVSTSAWETTATDEFKARLSSPYHMCAEACFQQISIWARLGISPHDVAMVFAEHEKLSLRIKDIFGSYMSAKPWSHVVSLTFSSPRSVVALQCSDMLSYESYVYWMKVESEGSFFGKERPALAMLSDSKRLTFSICYDEIGIKNAVRKFHADAGLYDPYPEL